MSNPRSSSTSPAPSGVSVAKSVPPPHLQPPAAAASGRTPSPGARSLPPVFDDNVSDHSEHEHGHPQALPKIRRGSSKKHHHSGILAPLARLASQHNTPVDSTQTTAHTTPTQTPPQPHQPQSHVDDIVLAQQKDTTLTRQPSRMSQRSNRTFLDPAALINVPEPGDDVVERRRERSGTILSTHTLRRQDSNETTYVSDGEQKEKDLDDGEKTGSEDEVAVNVQPDGHEIAYPDGGLAAWLVLLGAVCASFCAFGLAASVGAFQSYYHQNLLKQYPSSTIAWIGSAQAAICFSTCLFTGPLFDRFGPKPLLATGTFLLVLAFCMLSLCKEYYQIFLCHATLMAMGMDLMFIVPMGAVGQWFFLKRGLAFGIVMTGSSAGAIIWPAIVANLPQKIGFGWTMRVIALLMGVLGVTSTILIRTRLPPRPPGPFFWFKEFRNPVYLFVCLSFPFLVFSLFSFLTFIGTYGTVAGLGDLAPYLLMITNGSSGFGRVFGGLAADRFGTYNVAFAGCAVMVILLFCWLAMKSAGAVIALCVLFGFASGSPVSLQGPMVTAAGIDPHLAGTLIGQSLLGQSIAQLTGPPIFGAIIGTGTNEEMMARFPGAIGFGAGCLTVCMICMFAAKLSKDRNIFAKV